jgi:hypothetical protein
MIIMMIFNMSTSYFAQKFISLFWGLFNDGNWPLRQGIDDYYKEIKIFDYSKSIGTNFFDMNFFCCHYYIYK